MEVTGYILDMLKSHSICTADIEYRSDGERHFETGSDSFNLVRNSGMSAMFSDEEIIAGIETMVFFGKIKEQKSKSKSSRWWSL